MPTLKKIPNKGILVVNILFLFFAVTLFLYFIVGEIVLPKESESMKGNREKLNLMWTVISPEGFDEPIPMPNDFNTKRGETVIIESTLPEKDLTGLTIMTWCPANDVKIYINDEVRLDFNSKNSRFFGAANCANYAFFDLIKEDSGAKIRLESTGYDRSAGRISSIFIEKKSELLKYIIYDNKVPLLGGLFVIFVSLICLISSYVLTIVMKKHIRMAYLSWGVLFTAIWILFNSPMRLFLFPNQSVVGEVIFFSVGILALPFTLYLNDLQKFRHNTLCLIGCSLSLFSILIAIVIYTTAGIPISRLYFLFAFSSVSCMLFLVVAIILDVVGHHIREYKLTAIGVFIMSLCGLLEIAKYIMRIGWLSDGSLLLLGLLVILTFAIIDTVSDFIHVADEKEAAVHAQMEQAHFLANMSHEIRTPINAILGMNEIILRKEKDPEIASYAQDIKIAGDSLLSLVNDVLDYSKIESGKLDIIPEEYSVPGLVTAAGNMIMGKAEDKGLRFTINIDSTTPQSLVGDEIRIRQIAINLLSNAVKYTEKGSIRFSVGYIKNEATENTPEQFLLKLIVADTGIGIKDEDQDKLFDSFKRVDIRKNRTVQGAGLGLSITRELVELMGGKINVKSEYGFGSTFTVLLPQSVADETPVGTYSFGQSLSSQAPDVFSHIINAHDARILVVDDVAMNLRVFAKLLDGTGIDVDTAISGKEALARCSVKNYRMIFLDHMMPEMDGVETFVKLKENSEGLNFNTPVIMLTANALSTAEGEYIDLGFSDYLSKPVSLKDLEEMILKYLPDECLS